MRDTSQLVESLYDAVLDFKLWPTVLEDISDALGGAGSALLSSSKQSGVWVRVDPAARSLFESRFVSRNPIHAYVTLARQSPNYRPIIATDRDIAKVFDLSHSDYFHEFLRPYDGVYSLGLDLGVRNMTAALNISRTMKQGPFTEQELATAEMLHPHLIRAFWLSVRLAERKRVSDGMLELLEQATFAAFVLEENSRIAHMNASAATMLRAHNGLRCQDSMLATLRSDTTASLRKLIANAVGPRAGGRMGGTLTVARHARLPLTVTVTPLRGERPGMFASGPSAIVCAFDPTSTTTFSSAHLQEMFGLSAAEARVGVKLLEGLDAKATAQALGISFFTVRAHLAQIFQKTHTNRQAEFVSLVMRSLNPALFETAQ